MSYLPKILKTLPLYGDFREQQRLYVEQRRILEQRAEFVKRFKRLEGTPDREAIDPVLRFHLGLDGQE